MNRFDRLVLLAFIGFVAVFCIWFAIDASRH